MSRSIAIDNAGPIEHLDIPVPEGGGIVVLRGRNGRGKSHALRAVSSIGSSERVAIRDGADKATIEGLGVRITVGRRTSRSGQLEVRVLEGEDPSLLVDPGLKDPAAADRRRLEAILRLARAAPRSALFAGLVGGEARLQELAHPDTLRAPDLPDMAARLKRDLERAARLEEGRAENHRGAAQALAGAAGTPTEAVDLTGLRTALEAANVAVAREEEQTAAAREAADKAAEARVALVEAEKDYPGPTSEEARKTLEDRQGELEESREALRKAEARVHQCQAATDRAEGVLRSAEIHERTVARWSQALDAAQGFEIDPARLGELRQAADEADTAYREATLLAERQKERAKYEAALQAATKAEQAAEELREAAAGVEGVLSTAFEKVAPDGLRVEGGRLVLDTARGVTPLSELSPGERWTIAIGIAVRVGCDLMAIPQEAYEALDPENKAAALAAAKEHGVLIVAAEASEGELRAEVLE